MVFKILWCVEAAIKALREGKDLSGQDGVLTPLIKKLAEAAMQAEVSSLALLPACKLDAKRRRLLKQPVNRHTWQVPLCWLLALLPVAAALYCYLYAHSSR